MRRNLPCSKRGENSVRVGVEKHLWIDWIFVVEYFPSWKLLYLILLYFPSWKLLYKSFQEGKYSTTKIWRNPRQPKCSSFPKIDWMDSCFVNNTAESSKKAVADIKSVQLTKNDIPIKTPTFFFDYMAPLSIQSIHRCFAAPTRTQFSPRLEHGEWEIYGWLCQAGERSRLPIHFFLVAQGRMKNVRQKPSQNPSKLKDILLYPR